MSDFPTTAMATRMPAHIDSDGCIATDVACLNCGYDLRGLTVDDGCPECGMAVRTSLRGDRLADAPAAWRRRLRRGAWLAQVGTVLTLPLAGLPVATVGLWLLTTPEPGREEPASDERFRWSARTLLLAGTLVLLGAVVYPGLLLAVEPRAALHNRWGYTDVALIGGAGLFALGFLAATVYIEALAQRIPDEPLQRKAARTRRHWLAGLTAFVLVGLATRAADFAYTRFDIYSPYAAAAFACIVAAVLLWLWVVTLQLLAALRHKLPA